ncbi:TPA: hypothetical protein NR353_003268 [Legionella pneumophila]|jgi:transposase-like protein|uniref:Transposase n=1 Tax=Legionella waltersii TaxID=66969 RepID=A0A0W1AGE1_9GAMM|nr:MULTISPECIES: hypothetical protein [Legionella]HAT1919901.1 hypothetical protein [Legionella pneumophila]KTD80386.1 hypothetical protein Lwal_1083 [Legionella waltersii]MBN5937363.1 hypothetical protein [Legionella anisa]SNV10238.1 Uncharacterised protein [Legionella waltersii]HAT7779744.1 hypothetical protein [Legionella pneumophila]
MSKRSSRSYDKEFKLNPVKLYLESEHSYRQIEDEIGAPETKLSIITTHTYSVY